MPKHPQPEAPRNAKPTGKPGRSAAAVAVEALLVALVATVAFFGPSLLPRHAPADQGPTEAALIVLEEPADPGVAAADFEVLLVQAGTANPYTGHGAAGILLTVHTVGGVMDWTVEGWANQTKASGPCREPGLHYTQWPAESRADASGTTAVFTARLGTDPARFLPDGDQCGLRFAAFGEWTIHVRVEGGNETGEKEPPRGLHVKDGALVHDDWDVRLNRTVRVA